MRTCVMRTASETRTWVLRRSETAHDLVAYLKQHAGPAAESGKPLSVTVSVYREKRTPKQNGLLHELLQHIADQVVVEGRRFDLETWKEQVRRRFVGIEEVPLPDGTRQQRGMSTSDLNVAQFSDLIDKVRAWAVDELHVHLDEF